MTNEEMVRQIESATTVDGLLEIPIPKTDQSDRFAVYRVNSIQGQELEDAYLSVDLLELSLDKEGNQQAKTKSLVQHAVLSAEQRKQLVENASLLKEAMTEYRKRSEGLYVSNIGLSLRSQSASLRRSVAPPPNRN